MYVHTYLHTNTKLWVSKWTELCTYVHVEEDKSVHQHHNSLELLPPIIVEEEGYDPTEGFAVSWLKGGWGCGGIMECSGADQEHTYQCVYTSVYVCLSIRKSTHVATPSHHQIYYL